MRMKEWRSHRDLNPELRFRKPPFYPVKLWELDAGVVLAQQTPAVSPKFNGFLGKTQDHSIAIKRRIESMIVPA